MGEERRTWWRRGEEADVSLNSNKPTLKGGEQHGNKVPIPTQVLRSDSRHDVHHAIQHNANACAVPEYFQNYF